MRKTLEELFWSKVDKTSSCWIWTAAKDRDGYGLFNYNNKIYRAHRMSKLLVGEDPTGLHVCHSCDNPSCVREDHLFLGTNNQNMKDKTNKNRQAVGSKINTAKLIDTEVISIRNEHSQGIPVKELAIKYNVHKVNIRAIIQRKTWKHI